MFMSHVHDRKFKKSLMQKKNDEALFGGEFVD
jgi:hypothetical protein